MHRKTNMRAIIALVSSRILLMPIHGLPEPRPGQISTFKLGSYGNLDLGFSHLPVGTQHFLLFGMKQLLEGACYEFSQRWLRKVVAKRKWSHVSHVELHTWRGLVKNCKVPPEAIDTSKDLHELFGRINPVRHRAVHVSTMNIPMQSFVWMLQDAMDITSKCPWLFFFSWMSRDC